MKSSVDLIIKSLVMQNQIRSFEDRIRSYMSRTDQNVEHHSVLVGVSGGVDSVVLLDVLCGLGHTCEVVHVNYHLRGKDSHEDEKFVSDLCHKCGLNLHLHDAPIHDHVANLSSSIQMIAREVRYDLFVQTAMKREISVVAVGHHADDQAETLLMNLNRGTGPEGIAGMRPMRPLDRQITLIRPFLAESRDSILAFARARNLQWREDSSNQDNKYLRSKIRSSVIPHLNAKALARSSHLVRQWMDQVITPLIQDQFSAISEESSLKITALKNLPDILAQRLVMEGVRRWIPDAIVDEALVERIIGLMDLQSGKRIEAGGGLIWRDRHHLIFQKSSLRQSIQEVQCLSGSTSVAIPAGSLQLNFFHEPPEELHMDDGIWLDAEKLDLPLTVRTWLPGDRIQPYGMEGTKKISDLLTDLAISVTERKQVMVVCSGEDIVWVVGHRMSHQFRITNSTRKYAKICFSRN